MFLPVRAYLQCASEWRKTVIRVVAGTLRALNFILHRLPRAAIKGCGIEHFKGGIFTVDGHPIPVWLYRGSRGEYHIAFVPDNDPEHFQTHNA